MSGPVIEIKLPREYNYINSLNFVFIDKLATPELWVELDRSLLILYDNKPILLKFSEKTIKVFSSKSELALRETVMRKLNLVASSLEAYREGLKFFEVKGLRDYIRYLKGFIPPILGDGSRWFYTGLVKTILLQFVSYKVARIMINRFIRSFGSKIEFKDYQTWSFPEPEQILAIPIEELKQRPRISRVKAQAIKLVAELERDGILASLEREAYKDPAMVVKELMKLKGIGYWTAHVALMAGLGIWHAQPLDRLEKTLRSLNIDPRGLKDLTPSAWGYISVALLFAEEARQGRYFKYRDKM
ncbi:MAG: hypothetical protein LRS47_03155 [Desulfurococcales archaeon]|nr:hypothetical protein [Desulfurococcales archaeon]